MLDFYGLRKLLAQKTLWTTEVEHSNVINTVTQASSFNLPKNLINEVFSYGWKSYEFNQQKSIFCDKIRSNNPFPPLPAHFLQELSEQEMRNYIEKLYAVLQNQFDECIEKLYSINRNDEDFAQAKDIFSRKFLKAIKFETRIGLFSIAWCIVAAIVMFIAKEIQLFPFIILPIAVIFVIFFFFGISMDKYFKIGKNRYPKI